MKLRFLYKPSVYCFLVGLFLLNACGTLGTKSTTMGKKKRPDPQTVDGRVRISGPIVQRKRMKKNGEWSGEVDFYVQRSVQDYFIKFCESEVTLEAFQEHWEGIDSMIKTMGLEVEFREGLWDQCGEEEVQSRVGPYLVVYQIY